MRVTGPGWSGKTAMLSHLINQLSLENADLLVLRDEDEPFDSPAGCVADSIPQFEEALLRLITPRLVGDTDRPLVLVVTAIGAAGSAGGDVLRIARHSSALNAYVLTEDKFYRAAGNGYGEDFWDIQATKLFMSYQQAMVGYGEGPTVSFIPPANVDPSASA